MVQSIEELRCQLIRTDGSSCGDVRLGYKENAMEVRFSAAPGTWGQPLMARRAGVERSALLSVRRRCDTAGDEHHGPSKRLGRRSLGRNARVRTAGVFSGVIAAKYAALTPPLSSCTG